MPRVASPHSCNDHRYFTWSYIFIRHISWVLLGASCIIWVFAYFAFLFCVIYPCWTHLFEGAKIMLWLVRIALYASLKSFWAKICSSASLISFWARCALIFLKKCSHASLRSIWELVNFWRNSLMLHLYYFERWKFYAHVLHLNLFKLSKATYETSPKVIDIQGG